MKRIGYTWNDEYRKQFFESPKVQAHLAEFIERAKQPKSPETREKMSRAKLGKAKSAEHKARLSESHKFRQSLRRDIETLHPDLPEHTIWTMVREEMSNVNSD